MSRRRLAWRLGRREVLQGMQLYQRPGCPFCLRVHAWLWWQRLAIPGCNIGQDAEALKALAQEGGQVQVPCLRLAVTGGEDLWLYESADIIRYLRDLRLND